ncbi:hypothetical protein V5T82_18155, partial [Magnetovibrio sp. PR-2]|uniref:hypothetical protein n=1 Tax=Magnetovibrio sp. PR-2 TaxID=3120356 RepID=UPI002FCE537B
MIEPTHITWTTAISITALLRKNAKSITFIAWGLSAMLFCAPVQSEPLQHPEQSGGMPAIILVENQKGGPAELENPCPNGEPECLLTPQMCERVPRICDMPP